MAPSAETTTPSSSGSDVYNSNSVRDNQKNVTFAVNYEPSFVDHYWKDGYVKSVGKSTSTSTCGEQDAASTSGDSHSEDHQHPPPSASTCTPSVHHANEENDAPNIVRVRFEQTAFPPRATIQSCTTTSSTTDSSSNNATAGTGKDRTRRSNRESKKQKVTLVSTRVRYDMESVPYVERNLVFLASARAAALQRPARSCPCSKPEQPPQQPFLNDSSVIWIPSKRNEWDDSVSEMTAVCTSAALRQHDPSKQKAFLPPLSRDYIRDRIDIDDPLNGYQIRSRVGGWLQGFCLWTNFTTWTHFFEWDSMHPLSGLQAHTDPHLADLDGSLAQQLQAQPRTGDPSDSGIVFPTVAEIALLGALGSGEYLLRMALDDIIKAGRYQYVVLQATEFSKPFYQRFGFRRVGAVCRYGSRGERGATIIPTLSSPMQGYRHWTHANESAKSLDLHGGPSYMMCLVLDDPADTNVTIDTSSSCQACGEVVPSFLDRLMSLQVQNKPTIQQLGAAATPATKKRQRKNSVSSVTTTAKPGSNHHHIPTSITKIHPTPKTTTTTSSTSRPKRVYSSLDLPADGSHNNTTNNNEDGLPADKRRRLSGPTPTLPPSMDLLRDNLLTPPPQGKALTYHQKQYQSVWLAVPPQEKQGARRAPRNRLDGVGGNANATTPMATGSMTAPNFSLLATPMTSSILKATTPKSLKKSGTHKTGTPATSTKKKKTKSTSPSSSKKKVAASPITTTTASSLTSPGPEVNYVTCLQPGGPHPIQKATLHKQKVKSYPRDRLHFYNKVVAKKGPPSGTTTTTWYFVLFYNETAQQLIVVPMEPRGILSGKRQGRPRFQCVVGDTDANFLQVSTHDYEPVEAFMVMKTPNVTQEAWDILAA
jgi:hypothetical protein